MKHKFIFPVFLFILLLATFGACKKDEVRCTDDNAFCALVNDRDYEATGAMVNEFLESLKKESQDESLQKLTKWLECKSCVDRAEILCNSCILTNLPQSEIEVVFLNKWTTDTLVMDIMMEAPLKFLSYHEHE